MENREMLPFAIPTPGTYGDGIIPKITEVIKSKIHVGGKNVKELEKKLSSRYNRNVIAVSSGTSGLIIALDSILKDKREVIVPSLSFSATVQSIIHADAKPVFADVYENNWTLDVSDVERKINDNTGAIMPVNLFGVPCNVEAFERLGEKYNIPIIYDSCQAFGAQTPLGEIGTFGDIEVFSLDVTKIVSAGLGGIVVVKDDEIYNKIIMAKNFGNDSDKIPRVRGVNARMHEFNAILANTNLKGLEDNLTITRRNAEEYKTILSENKNIKFQESYIALSSPQYFGIFLDHSDPEIGYKIKDALLEKGIETRIYNPSNLHKNPVFSKENPTLEVTEKMCSKILCLPTHEKVELHHKNTIKETLQELLR